MAAWSVVLFTANDWNYGRHVMKKGKASIEFRKKPRILGASSVVGPKEGEGPLGKLFDQVEQDDKFGKKTWEEAESELQKRAAELVIQKAAVAKPSIRYLFAGDLLGQDIATSFGLLDMNIPLFGLYGACSTMGESLSLGSIVMSAGYADYVMCLTSSHFASAEKEFRYPLEYGNQRAASATWTVTGSGAVILGQEGGFAQIAGITTGKIIDYGVRDSQNMGAAMAPAAADTIAQNLQDFEILPSEYDKIITGDLGKVGQRALIDLLKNQGYDIEKQHMDCGLEIYNMEAQNAEAGGSGCGCAAVTLCSYVLRMIQEKTWKKILFVPTGALLSKTSFNEGQTIPGIAHAVVIEQVE